jgi:hypothetical protein
MSTYDWNAFLDGEREEEYVNRPLTEPEYQRLCLVSGPVDFRLELLSVDFPSEKPEEEYSSVELNSQASFRGH